jgi:anti-sigma factor RsiW
MNGCPFPRERVADLLDGLLEPGEADAARAHLATCAACAAEAERLAARNARLYRPFAVAEPPADLAGRILARRGVRRRTHLVRALCYAAAFAAGVLVTLAATAGRATSAPSPTTDVPAPPAAVASPIPYVPPPLTPRRIR